MPLFNIFEQHTNISNIEEHKLIEARKRKSRFFANVREKAKPERCLLCGKKIDGFCNSHSIPAFCLENIALNGKIYNFNKLVDVPLIDKDNGVKNAGVFHLICDSCDNTVFQEYENPNNYEFSHLPTQKMLAQIALKLSLKYLSKRALEIVTDDEKPKNDFPELFQSAIGQTTRHLDLIDYAKDFEKAKKACCKNSENEYYLIYYSLLDYVAPIAIQGIVALISDFDGNCVNDIYNHNENYHIKNLYLCVFPLKNKTAIMLFIDNNESRYRKFYKKFNKVSQQEKLAIINYLIFLYSEDVFMSKSIPENLINNITLKKLAGKTPIPQIKDLAYLKEQTLKEFKIENWNSIPNFLAEENKLR